MGDSCVTMTLLCLWASWQVLGSFVIKTWLGLRGSGIGVGTGWR